MNGIKTIFGKEVFRIFKDKKMIFSVFLLPVVAMVGIMILVSSLAEGMMANIESHIPIVYIENEPESFKDFAINDKFEYNLVTNETERIQTKEKIFNGEVDVLIEFPENFDESIVNFADGDELPQIKTYYNPSEDYSAEAHWSISEQMLEQYRQQLLIERFGDLDKITLFTVNSDNQEMIIQDEAKASGKELGMMLPYFITILLFAGAMGIGTDMVAGEKERGTMASLLMTPIKRSSIALGKVFALMSLAGLSAVISVVAMVVFAPMMMGGSAATSGVSLSLQQMVMLGLLLIAISFLYSTIIALLSVFAKTTKEATAYVMPVYMLILVLGMMTMFNMGETSAKLFFVPIYNTALVLQGILTQEVTTFQYGITLGVTVVISTLLIGVIVKAFNSEKVMSA